jgi:hypothetical protein
VKWSALRNALTTYPRWVFVGTLRLLVLALLACGKFLALHLRRTFIADLRRLTVTKQEAARLRERGIQEETSRHYSVWRRSLLLVAAPATLLWALLQAFAALDFYLEDPELWSRFGVLSQGIRLLSQFALPGAALAGALLWARLRLSRALVGWGWAVSLAIPLLVAFFPTHWLFRLDRLTEVQMESFVRVLSPFAPGAFEDSDLDRLRQSLQERLGDRAAAHAYQVALHRALQRVVNAFGGVVYGFLLLPAVLALLPGLLKACIRSKYLMPTAILPGWVLLVVTPFCFLLLLIGLVLAHQITGSPLLVAAGLLLTVAPLAYLLNSRVILEPLRATRGRLRRVEWVFNSCIFLALVLVLTFLVQTEVRLFDQRKTLLGWSEEESWMGLSGVLLFCFEYLGRMLYTSVVMADLFVGMNLSAWEQMKRLMDAAPEETDEAFFGEMTVVLHGPPGHCRDGLELAPQSSQGVQ